jgi:hypothetical protein
MGLAVVALHLLLALALWQALRTREIAVTPERSALIWLRPSLSAARQVPATPRPADVRRRPEVRPPVATAIPAVPASHESTWVEAPVATAEPAASAASAPPMERLLDTQATRIAIRQSARQPGLQESAAQAMGDEIGRTDTGLAGGVASAGKPDCAKMEASGGLLGLPLLAAMVASGKCTTK